MADGVSRYQLTVALNRDEVDILEQDLRPTVHFNATASSHWLSLKFRAHAIKRFVARDAVITVRRMLNATSGHHLDLHCNRPRTSEKTAVSNSRSVRAIIRRFIP